MDGARRFIPAPLRVGTGPTPAELAELVAVDVAAELGRRRDGPADWVLPLVRADVWMQWLVEQSLAREGLDPVSAGPEVFASRSAEVEQEQLERVAGVLAAAGLCPEEGTGPDPATAGATAFVSLYEAGLISFADRVVTSCPRCQTVVADAEVEAGEPASGEEVAVLAVPLVSGEEGGDVDAELFGAELLDGVAALVVPEGHPAAGDEATLPIVGRTVPVVPDPGAAGPFLLVPAHRRDHWSVAAARGLAAPVVMTADGTLTSGPWEGLARYAARQQALEALASAGALVGTRPDRSPSRRCRVCGTAVVDRLGSYWFLASASLAEAAAAAVAAGDVAVSPAVAGPAVGRALAATGDWCVSLQLRAGSPVPVGWCLDCRKPTVAVSGPGSCGACMGELRPDGSALDPWFVAASWAAEVLRDRGGTLVVPASVPEPEVIAVLHRLAGGSLAVAVLPAGAEGSEDHLLDAEAASELAGRLRRDPWTAEAAGVVLGEAS
ncbi:MAG TPA: class I tRNA ligase family protein [Acidimicrobiales bacterium]|nr:class I tRNA ligase family protein [Acidimicrobiales bacterium]